MTEMTTQTEIAQAAEDFLSDYANLHWSDRPCHIQIDRDATIYMVNGESEDDDGQVIPESRWTLADGGTTIDLGRDYRLPRMNREAALAVRHILLIDRI